MVSHFDQNKKKIVHRSVNACLAPLYSVEGMHVVTVEGIGNRRDGLHPVQERLSKAHGSQCGFCTPGFVMSMYSLLRSSTSPPSEEEIEENLAGNLCRCTGYRPILDAFRVFAKTDSNAYSEDSLKAAGAPPLANGKSNGTFVCPSTGKPCDCGKTKSEGNGAGEGGAADVAADVKHSKTNGNGCVHEEGSNGQPVLNGAASGNGDSHPGKSGEANGVSKKSTALYPTTSASEPIFPPELLSRVPHTLTLSGASKGCTWHRPTSLVDLLSLKEKFPDAKLVVGNSEVGIELRFKYTGYKCMIGTTAVPELNVIREESDGFFVGGACTLSNMMEAMRAAIKSRPRHETSACEAIVEQLRWFAGNQIRNVASVGGNVCTASPISDLNPLWMAARAVFTLASASGGTRQVAARDFFLGYRKVDLQPTEILVSVFLPWNRPHEYVKEFKQAHRRDDDIAIVNAGIRVQLHESGDGTWLVTDASLAYGGVAALSVSAKKTEAFLEGKPWTKETLEEALAVLRTDIIIPDTAPGGMPEFRRSLVGSFFFKFFLHVSFALEDSASISHGFPASYRSAAAPYEKKPSHGLQYFEAGPDGSVAGLPMRHMSADIQVSGEAEYADDVPMPHGGLHGALVLSTKPHAKILSVDPTPAESCKGFVAFYSHKDVPGHNDTGCVVHDEEVFASKEVTCVGQIIGVVVADSHLNAKLAARKIAIEYEELPAIFDIQEAIAAESFIYPPFSKDISRRMAMGDVEKAFASGECDHVIEGKVQVGGQEQFYLEPNVTMAWTLDNGSEVHMMSSTQAPTHHQKDVAHLLGLPLHKVVCKVKRIGGGFGGKETRSVLCAQAAAVAAWHLKKPVKIVLDRDTDMAITGQRHPFLGKYKVGFTSEGKVLALDLELFNNAGNSLDLSHSILERAMFHSENVYNIPNVRIVGKICKTNLPSNTAFRGFGGPQGMIITENWMEHVARTVKKTTAEVQELNFHGEGHEVHYGQVIERVQTQRIWREVRESGDFERRQAEVAAFNAANRFKKRGLALTPTKFGISFTTKFLNQGAALVNIYTDGTVLVSHGGVEMGQGLHTKVAQVVAATLDCPVADVFISETSTDKVPNTSPTAASASSDLYGQAALNACTQLLERMKPVKDTMPPGTTLAKVAEKCYFERINLQAQGFHATPELSFDWSTSKGHPFSYHTYGVALAEAEIDTLTGAFSLPRVDILMDLGKSINPSIDIGQVEGGFVQGLGWAVTEELKWGDAAHKWVRPGHLFTQGPGTYKIPSANDIPTDFRVTLLSDAPNPKAVMSSKAVGEPPLFLAASCLFAIKDAVLAARRESGLDGHFILDSPATPERVRMACVDEITTPIAPADLRPKLSI
eukprot:TRINITY_DN3802_c0_g1_i1.p1 TRINITY_DN3802_c0_g1~~TRINITY_DN3802_c0_g1_i1.p1  ORF type:complete len:1384 (-),score=303.69 TRINITY_DN3802_c0_g1_i1:1396-5484(-)